MRNLFVMIKNNLNVMILKKPVFFIVSILLPILIVIFMGKFMYADQVAINIGMAGEDNSLINKLIEDSIENNGSINVINVEENDIKSKIGEKSIDAAIVLDNDIYSKLFKGETDCVKVIGKEEDSTVDLVKEIISLELNNINMLIKGSKDESSFYEALENYNKKNMKIEKGILQNQERDNEISGIFVGFIIMFMFVKATLGANRINNDKYDKVYERFFVSGVKVWQYYLGNIIASLISILIQIILTLLCLNIFTNVNLGMSNLNMFIVLFLVSILAVSIGTFCIAITRKSEEASILSNILSMSLLMIGGCFVPIEFFPEFINKISKFLPTRWAMDMVFEFQNGVLVNELWRNIVVILLFSITFFLLAAYKTKFSEKRINI
ncbi:ABC transporter permease [Clostridium baratii]|uniref:ABC transporter permease n=1 Tax=Clostridium baratii TaxID=1561 RepID=UPI003D355C3A